MFTFLYIKTISKVFFVKKVIIARASDKTSENIVPRNPRFGGNHRGGRELLGQIAGGTHVVSSAARGKADSCHSNGFLG